MFLLALLLQAAQPAPATHVKLTVPAKVVEVIDGDTVKVDIAAWSNTPFETISVRIYGIDTPESHMPPGKCAAEVSLGNRAKAYAQSLAQPGDSVLVGYIQPDKYGGRIDGSITLHDGRDWATTMSSGGYSRPYFGDAKSDWCHPAAQDKTP